MKRPEMVERVGRASSELSVDIAEEVKRDGRRKSTGPRRRGRLTTR